MTANILLLKNSSLTLSLTARDTSENDETKNIYLNVDKALVERLRACLAEADRLDVGVTFEVPGGFEYGATNRPIAVRVNGDGQIDVTHVWGSNINKTLTFVTGGLHVSMIEEAWENVSTLPGKSGVGFMIDTAEFLLVVARDRIIEETERNTLLVQPKPDPEAKTIIDHADAVISAPKRPVYDGALHIFFGEDGSISMRE